MNNAKLCIETVKLLPIISTIAIIISFIFLLFKITIILNILSYPLSGSIAFCLLLLFLSKLFKFCKWHRVLILNLLFISIFSWINSLHRLASDFTTIWIILLASSLSALLSIILFIIHKKS